MVKNEQINIFFLIHMQCSPKVSLGWRRSFPNHNFILIPSSISNIVISIERNLLTSIGGKIFATSEASTYFRWALYMYICPDQIPVYLVYTGRTLAVYTGVHWWHWTYSVCTVYTASVRPVSTLTTLEFGLGVIAMTESPKSNRELEK